MTLVGNSVSGRWRRMRDWWRVHLASRAPARLIDPEGEGGYYLAADWSWGLHEIAADLGVTDERGRLDWRALEREYVWMRYGSEDEWVRSKWRARDAFKFARWQPALYCYATPPGDPT
jgi:hypothetical protein